MTLVNRFPFGSAHLPTYALLCIICSYICKRSKCMTCSYLLSSEVMLHLYLDNSSISDLQCMIRCQ